MEGDFIGAEGVLHTGKGSHVGRRSQAMRVVGQVLRREGSLPIPDTVWETEALPSPAMREVLIRPVADAGQPEMPFIAHIPVSERNLPA
jgi:hypothetical protein